MQVHTFNSYNPEAVMKFKLKEHLKANIRSITMVLKFIEVLQPKLLDEYVGSLEIILRSEINGYQIDTEFDSQSLVDEANIIKQFPALIDLIVLYSFRYLNLSSIEVDEDDELETLVLDFLRSMMILKFHRVKVLTDILGREDGIDLWKQIVRRATEVALHENKEELRPPIPEMIQNWIKVGSDPNTTGDFSVIIYDDYKFMLKTTRCGVHEVTKHLGDPELAYLSYCWTGNVEDELNKLSRRSRTTHTLHLADYCDEFFWDQDVHDNPEQPNVDSFGNE